MEELADALAEMSELDRIVEVRKLEEGAGT